MSSKQSNSLYRRENWTGHSQIFPFEPSYFKSRRYDPRPKFSFFSEMKSLIKKTFMGKINSNEAVIVRKFLFWYGAHQAWPYRLYLAKIGQKSGKKLKGRGGFRDARQKAKKGKNHKVELIWWGISIIRFFLAHRPCLGPYRLHITKFGHILPILSYLRHKSLEATIRKICPNLVTCSRYGPKHGRWARKRLMMDIPHQIRSRLWFSPFFAFGAHT